jgi:hypothetical protein
MIVNIDIYAHFIKFKDILNDINQIDAIYDDNRCLKYVRDKIIYYRFIGPYKVWKNYVYRLYIENPETNINIVLSSSNTLYRTTCIGQYSGIRTYRFINTHGYRPAWLSKCIDVKIE